MSNEDDKPLDSDLIEDLISSGVDLEPVSEPQQQESAVDDTPATTTSGGVLEPDTNAYHAVSVLVNKYTGKKLFTQHDSDRSDKLQHATHRLLRRIKGTNLALRFNTEQTSLKNSFHIGLMIEFFQITYWNNTVLVQEFQKRRKGDDMIIVCNKIEAPSNITWSPDGLGKVVKWFCKYGLFVETSDSGIAMKLLETTGLTIKTPSLMRRKRYLLLSKKDTAKAIESITKSKGDKVLAERWEYSDPAIKQVMDRAEQMFFKVTLTDYKGYPIKTLLPSIIKVHSEGSNVYKFNHKLNCEDMWKYYKNPKFPESGAQRLPNRTTRAYRAIPFWYKKLGFKNLTEILEYRKPKIEISKITHDDEVTI